MLSLNRASPDERLRVYLNDHLAGATGGLGLAKRMAGRESGPASTAMGELVADIEGDLRTLKEIIAAFDFAQAGPKRVLADVVEKVGRLKLNGQIFGHSMLSEMEELEMLSLGIMGKHKLWLALREIADRRPELKKFDFDKLETQARLQHDRVEGLRMQTVGDALAGTRDEPDAATSDDTEGEPAKAS